MLENLNLETFTAQLNTTFRVLLDVPAATPDAAPLETPDAVELELIEATDLTTTPRQERFSLVFRGPLAIFLGQGTREIAHEKIGAFDLFLVPIAREADGFRYEAIFNRLVQK